MIRYKLQKRRFILTCWHILVDDAHDVDSSGEWWAGFGGDPLQELNADSGRTGQRYGEDLNMNSIFNLII